MDSSVLKDVGFSDNEIRVYLELRKSRQIVASKLAERAGINRTLCYLVLKRLAAKGLVGYVLKNNVKYFVAAHPERILDYLSEKQQLIQELVPSILSLVPTEEKEYSVELFEGKEGLKTVLSDALRSKPKEFLDFTSGMTNILLPPYFIDQWEKKRIHLKIKGRFLFNDTEIGKSRGAVISKLPLTEVKYLPEGLSAPCHIYIYANKVGIALWAESAPFGVLIKNEQIANRFREFFNWVWKISK